MSDIILTHSSSQLCFVLQPWVVSTNNDILHSRSRSYVLEQSPQNFPTGTLWDLVNHLQLVDPLVPYFAVADILQKLPANVVQVPRLGL